jgi:hypothetical protein
MSNLSSTARRLPACPASDQRDAGSAVKLLVIELLVALAIVVGIMVLWSYILTPIPVY